MPQYRSKYTLSPTTSRGRRIEMPWDREDDPSQEEIDAFDLKTNPPTQSEKPTAPLKIPEFHIPVGQFRQTQKPPATATEGRQHLNTQELPPPEPDTYWGGFRKSLKDQFLGAAIPALEGAAQPETPGDFASLLIPGAAPSITRAFPALRRGARDTVNAGHAFTEHLRPVEPLTIGGEAAQQATQTATRLGGIPDVETVPSSRQPVPKTFDAGIPSSRRPKPQIPASVDDQLSSLERMFNDAPIAPKLRTPYVDLLDDFNALNKQSNNFTPTQRARFIELSKHLAERTGEMSKMTISERLAALGKSERGAVGDLGSHDSRMAQRIYDSELKAAAKRKALADPEYQKLSGVEQKAVLKQMQQLAVENQDAQLLKDFPKSPRSGVLDETGSIGEGPLPPGPERNARIRAALDKARADPEFQKLPRDQQKLVLDHIERGGGEAVPTQPMPRIPNVEGPSTPPGPRQVEWIGTERDPNLDIMKQPSMFHPNASPPMPGPVEPINASARIPTRIQQSRFPSMETQGQSLWEKAKDVGHGSREIMASGDFSAPFRQAAFTVSRKEFWKNLPDMFKSVKASNYERIMQEIESRPSFRMMQDSKLAFTDLGKNMGNREERFMSTLAAKIPGVKASAQSYTVFLNKLRADLFDDMITRARPLMNAEDFQKVVPHIANYINNATGRGTLGALESSATGLNSLFFAPRLAASRIKLISPHTYLDPRIPAFVRKEAIRDLLGFTTIGSTMLGLAQLAGADVETDPRSADFGKARFGKTRFDMFGGFTQYLRLGAQLVTNSTKSTNTGKITGLGSSPVVPTRLDVLYNFAQNKESPVPSFVTGFFSEKDYKGDKFEVTPQILQRITPMLWQDVYEVFKEDPKMLPFTIPASAMGIGVQSYTPRRRVKPNVPLGGKKTPWYGEFTPNFMDFTR